MNTVARLYLNKEQYDAVLDALPFCTMWLEGHTDGIFEILSKGKLINSDGNVMGTSMWGTMEARFARLNQYAVRAPARGWHSYDIGAPRYLGPLDTLREVLTFAQPTSGICWDTYSKTNALGVDKTHVKMLNISVNKVEEVGRLSLPEFEHAYCNVDNVYALDLRMEDVRALLVALDTYSRCLTHQWENLKDLSVDMWLREDNSIHDVERDTLSTKVLWCGFSNHSSHGIYGKVHNDARIIWNVYKSLRHWDYVIRNGYSNRTGVATDALFSDSSPVYIQSAGVELGSALNGRLFYQNTNRLKETIWNVVEDPRKTGFPMTAQGHSHSLVFLSASLEHAAPKTPQLDF